MAIAQFFFLLVLHVLILVFLKSGVVPKYEEKMRTVGWNADKLLSIGDSQSVSRSSIPIGRHKR